MVEGVATALDPDINLWETSGPYVKNWLRDELGPVAAFFAGYLALKDQTFTVAGESYGGFIVVTAAFVPLMLVSTGLLWRLTGQLSKMQLMTTVLVVLFGGLSVWLNDERFFKMKPTMIYLLFGTVLAAGLLRGRSYLAYAMDAALPLTETGWMILTRRLTAFFFALAITNEAVWRLFSTETWVTFKTFGLTAALFAFFMAQGRLFRTHARPEQDEG
ncbi:MAG: septation protein IspZ [Rhodobacterales bacterium]|nr:septation protein IspZ [Rhodobacterales bacterium]